MREFRRFTKLPNSERSNLEELHIHTGIVISSLNRQLFLGSQIAGNPIMSIMICKPVLSANVLFSGKALVAVPDRYQPIDLVIPSRPNMESKTSSSEMVEIFDAKAPELDKVAIEYLFDEKNFAEW
ncbi:hypothetical protein [Notoacmeibacter sp. MSK16QG-6]|uniref:hypothetical protein n=1 Tax=Notoacmeibacter sp. MSK16QG-6 TaxID=2957982 RepID=UPI0020A1F641|nr:hypothetical protein [Notoacmeibacter sp. MSK16QG-6]MCP1199679.1 hypothetical protein [Notoacmeibacter sp. MSK16QG-6]